MPRLNPALAPRGFALSLLTAAILTVAGCVSQPPLSPTVQRLPERVELEQVPFFPQSDHQGAPAALAELLTQQGVATTPEGLRQELRLPEQEARLQLNIEAVTNQHGLLLHPLRPNLPALLKQVAAGYPVLLRFNRGFSWLAQPRYAVLIGYDRNQQTLLLRSGDNQREEISFAEFAQDWSAAGQWAVLVLNPSQLPPSAAGPLPSGARESASAQTQELLALHKRWQSAPASERARLREQVLDKTQQRQQLLAQLAENDPAAALRASLPAAQQRQLTLVQDRLELPLQLEGTLAVLYEDLTDGEPRLRHFLDTPFGERFELSFAQAAPRQGSGKNVRLDGTLFGQAQADRDPLVAVESGDSSVVWLDAGGTNTTLDGSFVPAVEYSLGEQRTLLILVNFSDKAEQPWTLPQAQEMFNTLDAYIRENSAGRTWLSGEVAGWYTIALSSAVCDSYTLRNQALTIARNSGYTLSNYDRFIYAFPQNACGYSGSGSVGGKPTDAYINNHLILNTVAHEYGHNLGLDHAHALECGATTLGSSCSTYVYGDSLDVLGYQAGEGHYNPFNKQRLGWLKASEVLEVGNSGRFDLLPYTDLASSGVRVLKVPKANAPGNWYYVDFHQPVGFDAQLLDGTKVNVANVTNGVTIHQAGTSTYSQLLDMTPGTGGIVSDWKDPALEQGRSFSDPTAGVTLTTSWVDAQKAQVDVQLSGSATCTQGNPSVQVGAPVTQWGLPGQSLSYQVSLTNNDGAACSSRSFNLQNSQPSGWSSQFASTSLSAAPGQSASTSLSVTAASSAAAAYYDLSVSTTQAPTISATLTYVVQAGSSNRAPQAVNDSVKLSSLSAVNIAVLANDSDPDGNALSIVAFTQGAKGKVTLNSNGSLTYTPGKALKTTDQFSYSISDGKASATATVSISR